MGRAYLNERATGGAVASPYVGGLGGSTPLLVHFLGVSEKRTNLPIASYESCSIIRPYPEHLECLFVFRELLQILPCQHFLNLLLVSRIHECDTSALEACTRKTTTIDSSLLMSEKIVERTNLYLALFQVLAETISF